MKMYNNKFVVCIMHNGSIVKELDNGQVNLPFGAEYKIRLRNKHNRRAICKLSIDGENVSGGGFIIPANSHIDIERPADVSRKFKFVSLDSEEAHDFGKNGPNPNKTKGLIVAEFALEKEYLIWDYRPLINQPPRNPWRPYDPYYPGTKDYVRYTCYNNSNSAFNAQLNQTLFNETPLNSTNLSDGATVEGSHSYQKFQHVYFDHENDWTTIRMFLQGYEECAQSSLGKDYGGLRNNKSKKTDSELIALEKELIELQKLKLKKEIEALKKELNA